VCPVRRCPALVIAGLRVHPGPGFLFTHPSLRDQSADAVIDGGMHHHHEVKHRRHCTFHQQRNVLHDNGVLRCLGDKLSGAGADQRMQDAVQLPPCLVVAEHRRAQGSAVERSVGLQHRSPELGHQTPQTRSSRSHYFAGDQIGIHKHGAALGPPA